MGLIALIAPLGLKSKQSRKFIGAMPFRPFGPVSPFRPSLHRFSLDSSDIASRSSVRCPVPVLMPDSVRSVPIPPSTQPIVATLPLLLKKYMQQAMESLSRDDSQQRDRDPERSSGQRPKINDRDVNHRRFSVFDLKDLSDLKDLKVTTPCSRGANVP